MKFGISTEVAQAAQNNRKAPFDGDAIYDVTFTGCDARSFDSNGVTYKVLDIKFENDTNFYTHTIFEPRDGDDVRTESSFVGQDGKPAINPSRMDHLNMLIMHLFNATNPAFATGIVDGSQKFEPNSWEQLCDEIVKITSVGVGKKLKIKLLKIKTKDGIRAQFPGFPAKINKNGELYLSTTFIGDNVYFTKKENEEIKARANAVVTPVAASAIPGQISRPGTIPSAPQGVVPGAPAAPSPVGGATKRVSFSM